jgi:putative NIF3 family GTP cyclohydrolase 1 type 2
VTELLDREPLVQGNGPDRVGSIGIVSGAGADSVHEAAALGLDALLTGEPAEHAMADAAEAGLHLIAAGHYATETLGIRRLGELVAERFGVEHEFIDVPNPV